MTTVTDRPKTLVRGKGMASAATPTTAQAAAPLAASESPHSTIYCRISTELHDQIDQALWHARAVVAMLNGIFADQPGLYGDDDLLGLIQHVQWQLSEAKAAVKTIVGDLPDDLRRRLFEACALINIMEAVEEDSNLRFEGGLSMYSGYFGAIEQSISLALKALDRVPLVLKGDTA